jgi:hypothetical protein
MLMRNERLATLRTRLDLATDTLAIVFEGSESARADLRTSAGRQQIESFFAKFCADELRGPPKVLHAPDHSFSDVAKKVVSIINLASVAALEDAVGAAVAPLRFRANVYVDGWPAWHEFDLLGREITVGGGARLKVIKRIVDQCGSGYWGARPCDSRHADAKLRAWRLRSLCEVVAGGEIAVGDGLHASS